MLWRMYGPDSSLIGTLFHICRDVTITETSVQYLDLIIDIWIPAHGAPRVLDEDELEECRQQGLVSDEEMRWIRKQQALITDAHAEIIRQLQPVKGSERETEPAPCPDSTACSFSIQLPICVDIFLPCISLVLILKIFSAFGLSKDFL